MLDSLELVTEAATSPIQGLPSMQRQPLAPQKMPAIGQIAAHAPGRNMPHNAHPILAPGQTAPTFSHLGSLSWTTAAFFRPSSGSSRFSARAHLKTLEQRFELLVVAPRSKLDFSFCMLTRLFESSTVWITSSMTRYEFSIPLAI